LVLLFGVFVVSFKRCFHCVFLLLVFVKLIASFAGVITLATWEDANPPYSYVNLALQAAFTAGYIHQYSTMKDKNN
jgi:hypothetical protein